MYLNKMYVHLLLCYKIASAVLQLWNRWLLLRAHGKSRSSHRESQWEHGDGW